MSEIKAQSNNSPKGENKYFGFGLAAVFLIIGGVLFFSWSTFGGETPMKLFAIVFLIMGICGLGVELSNFTKNDGALEMCIGLGITLTIFILKDLFNNIPNLLVLLVFGFALIFILSSFTRLFFKEKNPSEQPKLIFRVIILIGQVSGAIANIGGLFKMLWS
ncbi:hypothetical protein [Bacillus sp. SKDU12]|uniref:hypothetical protein n=1 Tax=Bacillus sp. SKDU12 TaxID=1337053 RepID=UPI001389581A|nr:hypothetical protein BTW01_09720 [Bacillus sp. SKDU12]